MINERRVRRCRRQSQNSYMVALCQSRTYPHYSYHSGYTMSYYKVYIYLNIYIYIHVINNKSEDGYYREVQKVTLDSCEGTAVPFIMRHYVNPS